MSRKKSDPVLPPNRPLGRDTDATLANWGPIVSMRPRIPNIFRGQAPRKSPRLRRFDPHIPYYQVRGFCVGYAIAKAGMILQRIPVGATGESEPLPFEELNPIYSYDTSRIQCKKDGINLGSGDGSIVSCALKSIVVDGWVRKATYKPPGGREEQAHRNDSIPPAAAMKEGDEHLGVYGLCDTYQAAKELVGGGIPVDVGTPVTNGFMEADSKGFVTFGGGNVGGHSYLWVEYDEDENWALVSNSWPQWGIKTADPEWAHLGGYWNMAYVKLTAWEKMLSDKNLASGYCEAGAVSTIQGWRPLIHFDW